jgi:hypothetical protein
MVDDTSNLSQGLGKHILDDVLSAQMESEREEFDPGRVVAHLLAALPLRARNIVSERFGLNGKPKKTLEELGVAYSITRERVRQIESNALASFAEAKSRVLLEPSEKLIHSVLYENGEIMEEEKLIATLLDEERGTAANRNILLFILEFIPEFYYVPATHQMKAAWALRGIGIDRARSAIEVVIAHLEEKKSPVSEAELEQLLKENEKLQKIIPSGSVKVLLSYVDLSKEIAKNPFQQWGLSEWDMIVPKGVRDKAYLVMREHKKPLHFTKITDLINKTGFDKRIAHPQTVHNELIKDKRFVLVGRGIYALKEWGYGEGTVADILTTILKESNQPMSREELIEKVLKQRMVKRNTVIIGLQDKNLFEKVSGNKYTLKVNTGNEPVA